MQKNKFVTLDGHFQEIEDYNSTFKKVKIKVFAFDLNANNSDITRNAFTKAQSSIFNIPIIAKYNEEKDDLEGHNVYLTKDKNDKYVIKMDTSPFGVVSNLANISFEDINEGNEENPNIKTYVIIDNVFLWKRYEATQKIEEWLAQGVEPKVSMEIGSVEGKFESGVFEISSFEFEAITALGSDVEPCFPMAQIEEYSKATFQEAYFEMVKELKFSLQNQPPLGVDDINTKNTQEGGKGKLMDEKITELLAKYNLTKETISFSIDTLTLEEIEIKIKDQFSLSNSQLMTEINKIIEPMKEVRENYWGELVERHSFYLMDLKDDNAIVVNYDWDTYYGIPYSVNGDIVTLDFEAKVEFIPDWRPKQAGDTSLFTNVKEIIASEFAKVKEDTSTQIAEVNEKFTALELEKQEIQVKLDTATSEFNIISTEFELAKPELTRLKDFEATTLLTQRKEAEESIFSQFEQLNDNEQFQELKKNASQFTLEQLEEKSALIVVKSGLNVKFTAKPNKKQTVKLGLTHNHEESNNKPYGDLFDKFLPKED